MKTTLVKPAVVLSSNHPRNPAALSSFAARPDATESARRRFARLATEPLDPLAALQERVAAGLEQEFAGTLESRFIRQIVNEATALAATTAFPVLLLPALAEEKARQVSEWAARQHAIRQQALTFAA